MVRAVNERMVFLDQCVNDQHTELGHSGSFGSVQQQYLHGVTIPSTCSIVASLVALVVSKQDCETPCIKGIHMCKEGMRKVYR